MGKLYGRCSYNYFNSIVYYIANIFSFVDIDIIHYTFFTIGNLQFL